MKRLIPCLAAALLASCATGTAEQAPPPSPSNVGIASQAGEACPLTVVFGSYAMGIDRPTHSRVEALLAGDRAVTGFEATRWGREGEVTLCARTRTPADAARLFEAIRAMVPARPRGPVSIRTQGGLRYETPPLRR